MSYKKLKGKHKEAINERLSKIRSLAKKFKWDEMWHQESNRKLRFQRDDDFFDIFYTTMTVVKFIRNEDYNTAMVEELTQVYSKIDNEDELIELLA